MTENKKQGTPKKYKDPVTTQHTMERAMQDELNALVSFDKTRTDIINQAIDEFLERRTK